MIDGSEKRNWLLNLRIRMFVKSAVSKPGKWTTRYVLENKKY